MGRSLKCKTSLYFIVFILFSATTLNLSYASTSESFVYSYGGAKIWVFIDTNNTWAIKRDLNYTLYFEVYLESLGKNVGVFINRVTLSFRGTNLRQMISPNITLQSAGQSWTWNATFELVEHELSVYPGQSSTFDLNFEVRYDVIDSSETHWHYRVSDHIPVVIKNPSTPTSKPWTFAVTVFFLVLMSGMAIALIILWIKIRRYKKLAARA